MLKCANEPFPVDATEVDLTPYNLRQYLGCSDQEYRSVYEGFPFADMCSLYVRWAWKPRGVGYAMAFYQDPQDSRADSMKLFRIGTDAAWKEHSEIGSRLFGCDS